MENYILNRKRGMKNLRLRVETDGKVYVSAPLRASKAEIDSFVEKNADWIAAQRQKLADNFIEPRTEIRNGDMVNYFGKQYRVIAAEGEGKVYIDGDNMIVPCSDKAVTSKILDFLVWEGCTKCTEAAEYYLKKSGYSGTPIKFAYKLLKSKWGSCSTHTHTITFNLALCKLPEKYTYYVAAHEVVHLFVPNHSAEFYRNGELLYKDFLATDRELKKLRVGGFLS